MCIRCRFVLILGDKFSTKFISQILNFDVRTRDCITGWPVNRDVNSWKLLKRNKERQKDNGMKQGIIPRNLNSYYWLILLITLYKTYIWRYLDNLSQVTSSFYNAIIKFLFKIYWYLASKKLWKSLQRFSW